MSDSRKPEAPTTRSRPGLLTPLYIGCLLHAGVTGRGDAVGLVAASVEPLRPKATAFLWGRPQNRTLWKTIRAKRTPLWP